MLDCLNTNNKCDNIVLGDKMLELNNIYKMDCLEGMKQFPDKYFDWVIADPPYGGAGNEFKRDDKLRFGGRFDKYKLSRTGGTWASKYNKNIIEWDVSPQKEYFDEMFRVSKNQIIWGGNYFDLPPNRCFIVWIKTNIPENFTMSQCEYAWCSLNDNAKVYYGVSSRPNDGLNHFHPTEKPIALYEWIFSRFLNNGDKILDPYVGSGNSRIAAYNMGIDFVGFEIDDGYYEKSYENFDIYTSQTSLFKDNISENQEQISLL